MCCWGLEAEFLLLWGTLVFALKPFHQWDEAPYSIEGDLLSYQLHLNTKKYPHHTMQTGVRASSGAHSPAMWTPQMILTVITFPDRPRTVVVSLSQHASLRSEHHSSEEARPTRRAVAGPPSGSQNRLQGTSEACLMAFIGVA